MSDLPSPLTPTDCDLRDFPFIPLDVDRLRRSKAWLKAKRNPALAFYMVNLWTASWHDVPAGSLEDDDDVLADLARCEPVKWDKLRNDVLHGWIKCSDGRLYNPTVCEKAREAWDSKLDQRWRTECARIKKHNDRHGTTIPRPTFEEWVSSGCPSGQRLPVPRDNLGTGNGQVGETGSKREGEREGQGQGEFIKPSDPDGSDADASQGLSAHDAIFQIGLPWIVSNAGSDVKESNIRSMLGGAEKHLKPEGAWQLVQDCMRVKPLQPVAWLAAAINERKKVAPSAPAQRPARGNDRNDRTAAAAAIFGTGTTQGEVIDV